MTDSYGDGWNVSHLDLYVKSNFVSQHTIASGSSASDSFCVSSGKTFELDYTIGSYNNEVSFDLLDASGSVFYSDSQLSAGILYTGTCN